MTRLYSGSSLHQLLVQPEVGLLLSGFVGCSSGFPLQGGAGTLAHAILALETPGSCVGRQGSFLGWGPGAEGYLALVEGLCAYTD